MESGGLVVGPELGLVGGWAIHAGDGDIHEAQVDRELGAMVDEVVEDDGAQDLLAGHGHDGFAGPLHGPYGEQLLVGCGGQGGVGVGDILVEALEQLRASSRLEWGELAGLHGKDLDLHGVGDPAGEFGDVSGEVVDVPGFPVRLIVEASVGDALEHLACVGHLLIELGEQSVTNRHGELRI